MVHASFPALYLHFYLHICLISQLYPIFTPLISPCKKTQFSLSSPTLLLCFLRPPRRRPHSWLLLLRTHKHCFRDLSQKVVDSGRPEGKEAISSSKVRGEA